MGRGARRIRWNVAEEIEEETVGRDNWNLGRLLWKFKAVEISGNLWGDLLRSPRNGDYRACAGHVL